MLLVGFAAVGIGTFVLVLLRRAMGQQGDLTGANERLRLEGEALVRAVGELGLARGNAEAILAAVPVRLLLVDSAYQILENFSPDLEAVFRMQNLRGENLLNVLRRVLSETRFKAAREYLVGVFDPHKSAAELDAANPLEQVEVMLQRPDGSSVPRTLTFGFRRIVEAGDVARALIWVDDVTERIRRERQTHADDASKAKSFDLLLEIVHVPSPALDAFVAATQDDLRAIDAALRAGDEPPAERAATLRARIDEILQRVHAVESRAQQARLPSLQSRAAAYAKRVSETAARETLGGDDFLALVMEQSAFRAELDELQMLRARLAVPARDLVAEIGALARRTAGAVHKEVVVDAEGFDPSRLSSERRALLGAVLVELTRNAVTHGIELPDARLAFGKPRAGRIEIRSLPDANAFAFRFRDDGAGLDAARLRDRAVERGLLARDRADALPDTQAAALVFAPELSRGMSDIKRRVVEGAGGTISVDSQSGAFCEFSFTLPGA